MELYRLLYGFVLTIVWIWFEYCMDSYRILSGFVSTYIWTAYVIVYLIGVIYTLFIKKIQAKTHLCRVPGQGHTAKVPFFAMCKARAHGKGAVQRFCVCCVCRVPCRYGTRQTGCSTRLPPVHFILSCARNVAHGKLALCRPLFAVSCLPCVTLGKHFAECKAAFAVCPWHSANRHSPIVTLRSGHFTFDKSQLPYACMFFLLLIYTSSNTQADTSSSSSPAGCS